MLQQNYPDLDEISPKSDAIKIVGLTYINNYINREEQNQLINVIDREEWSTVLKRRVQQYGYKYDYKKGVLTSSIYLGALPDWAQNLANRLSADGLTTNVLDQLIINEYTPGQGISHHIDCASCFGNTIICVSLESSCVMDLTHSQTQEKASLLLSPGSVLVLQGAARYKWKHSIAARKKDNYKGEKFVRTRRVSLTFREVLFPYK